ncbi:MAG: LuxR C-terminal-related transcriptional regulator [Coriobacteriales bacterium]|jgi:LuxR family maltose regulon positive regulatory protein|nr:LuxR C-terminal-related transcriptional regulator [Coriobacteriales bacterium]
MAGRTKDAGPQVEVTGRKVLHRARLHALFERSLHHTVTFLVAGPGYGKSTAVALYLRAVSIKTVWVQLSARDNMPSHFWETFSQALLTLNAELGAMILSIGFPDTLSLRSYLSDLLKTELKPQQSYALVFDDLHLLENESILNFISQIAKFRSNNVSIIGISRRDNFPNAVEFSRDGQLARIDESDLSFTKSEMMEYFELMRVTVPNDLASDVFRDTEGWPFAVSLATRIIEQNPDNCTYVRTALRGTVNAIIDNELFAIISDEMRRFLMQMSLVRHLPLELIDEFKEGRRLIGELAALSSLVRYDNYMRVYRLHQLLQHYLEGKQDLLAEEERREANEKAARWCIANGYKIDALSYYRAMGDYGAIINIAYTYPPVMPFDVAFELLEIFENAPAEVFERYAEARILHTRLIIMTGRIDEAMAKTYEYIELLEARPLDEMTKRTLMGLHNNLGFAKLLLCPETHDYSFAPHFEKAREYYDVSFKLPTDGYQVYGVGPYALRLGRAQAGDAERYIEMLRRGMPCAELTLQGCGYGLDDLARAEYAFFRCMASEAEQYALRCLPLAHEHGQFEIESRALFLLMRVYLQKGKYEQLMDVLSRLDVVVEESNFANRYVLYEIITSWFYAAIGEVNRVERWLKSSLWSNDAGSVLDGLDDSVKIKYYLATRSYRTLLDFVESRTARYGISRYIIGKVGLMTIQSVCLFQLGQRQEAFDCLRETYKLVAPNGFDMALVEQGNSMRTLAGAALRAQVPDIPQPWLATIQSRATTYAKRVAHVRSRYLYAHDLEANVQLTSKELEILSDLAQGLSRMEISLAHNISTNTVKTMLRLIYEKLGAESAMDAIRIATTKQML